MSPRRKVVKDRYQQVPASELRPGDRIRAVSYPNGHPTLLTLEYNPTPWRVVALPVRLVGTKDVSVRVGIYNKTDDHGMNVRLPGEEPVTITRD